MGYPQGTDALLAIGTAYCRCVPCGECFRNDRAFRTHRTAGGCLTPEGMRGHGMAQDSKGYWITAPHTARTPP